MSDRSQGEGWWLASDGKWYPPESRPAPPPPPAPPLPPSPAFPDSPSGQMPTEAAWAFRSLSGGLSGTLAGFLWASAAFFLLGAVASLPYGSTWSDWVDGRASTLDLIEAEDLAVGLAGLAVLPAGVAGVLFIIWHYQAYKSADSLSPTGTRWSPGWAVGGWFIPLANLVIPKLVMNEVERISDPTSGPAPIGDRWKRLPIGSLGDLWWVTWVGGIILIWVAVGFQESADFIDSSSFRSSIYIRGAALAFLAISAALGASYVVRIRRRLSREPVP